MRYSIIIPVYNVADLLPKCIESILSQTISNFELILVNDGSTDDSGAVCDKYADKDDRIRVIHTPNRGVSSARNTGLDAAKGERIVFIDSDDYVEQNYLEEFSKSSADLVIAGYYREGYEIEQPFQKKYDSLHMPDITADTISKLFSSRMLNFVWSKSFNSEIIRKNQLKFDTTLSLAEDTLFVVEYIFMCGTVEQISATAYHYVKYSRETLTKRKLLSGEGFRRMLEPNRKIYTVLKKNIGQLADPLMLQRMGEGYEALLRSAVHDSDCSFNFIFMLFHDKWFREILNRVDDFFFMESPKYRALLKMKSAVLFWLFLKLKKR